MNAPEKPLIVGAFEAKTKLSNLLDRVEAGKEVVITRNGKPVARLMRFGTPVTQEARQAAIARMRKRAQAMTLDGVSLKELRDEGRKY
jgi:antitoxin (DNA-binding transcriptional repressor) of toxin-antitoxin stability system